MPKGKVFKLKPVGLKALLWAPKFLTAGAEIPDCATENVFSFGASAKTDSRWMPYCEFLAQGRQAEMQRPGRPISA